MAPTQAGTSPQHRPPHKAVPHVVPNTDPKQFAGRCAAGDFSSTVARNTEAEAMEDVAAHVALTQNA